ncbi:MAG: group II intron reverse transcriptase/maturase [Anaerolineae bacterium]|nr:group II intron reverse transcriptase/maturase [Anaerolineae bacterium]
MDWRWWKRREDKPVIAEDAAPKAASQPATPRPGLKRSSPRSAGAQRLRETHPAFGAEALRRAWQQVKANGGGPGVDGLDIAAFEAHLDAHLAALQTELCQGTYRPQPVRRVLIPKRNEGLRPLAIWTLRDRVAQRAVLNALEPIFEPQFLACSHGYRPGRSTQTASDAVVAARNEGLRWVLDADIQDCFDSIDPELLMQMLRRQVRDRHMLRLVELWLQARILSASGQVRAAGAAQGGVLSPLLSNIYLHPFDVALTRQGLRLVRYADDFVVLCRRRRDAEEAQAAAEAALQDLRLQLNPHKTRLVHFDQGFKFLGRFFVRDEVYEL